MPLILPPCHKRDGIDILAFYAFQATEHVPKVLVQLTAYASKTRKSVASTTDLFSSGCFHERAAPLSMQICYAHSHMSTQDTKVCGSCMHAIY